MDSLVHYLMLDGQFRCAIADTTEVVRTITERHRLDPIACIAVGRAVSAAVVTGSIIKQDEEYVHFCFDGSGPLKQVVAECNGEGRCRGYAAVPRLAEVLPEGSDFPQTVKEALGGEGKIVVTHGRPGFKQPHTAISELANGGIAMDVAKYLSESEQVPSAIATGVHLSSSGEVESAGAVLVQKMGGVKLDEKTLAEMESRLESLAIASQIQKTSSLDDIVAFIADGKDNFERVSEPKKLHFGCSCSSEKMIGAIKSMKQEDLESLADENGQIEISCPWCLKAEQFSIAQKH